MTGPGQTFTDSTDIPEGEGIFAEHTALVLDFQEQIRLRYTPEEQERINLALLFMFHVHDGQLQKGTYIPYALHPLTVARMVAISIKIPDADMVIAALLHDTVEDDPNRVISIVRDQFHLPAEMPMSPYEAIALLTGSSEVADLVGLLTSRYKIELDHTGLEVGSMHYLAERNRLHMEYLEAIRTHSRALIIKLCDVLTNAENHFKPIPTDPDEALIRRNYAIKDYPVLHFMTLAILSKPGLNISPEILEVLLLQLRETMTLLESNYPVFCKTGFTH